ncbi:hypothetical protein PtrSN002B_003365 [Pyrenophora tritici-repentis]|uniref:TT-ORF1 multi-domain protein n=2 Tax=Pyrenophora tritici-repentis TaxID=45151 RepID=A0A2W1F402_9PLEO|nr:uncharacterized protein PTRG_08223 [Pyrenophora tritici-repentis Pt-1C-BFP]KAA8615844.1 hypothetical protein PtrV1_11240 [Pyrenophora tritici-repentis]EDU51142.1 predicted protein [Pyrenophora tritici-repentis Pt-1C-BFP]KAF7443561.1 hypothetical protein A1F99_116350 [Pyrenophora tritici-repentis]KAF7566723.1 TT-ORF1 multi-domain protein [Pyrenophora tritici-repentis]KAG9379301.1 hypothetical protein A1F94_009657 [Pyrenophora tritici-repentis]
MAYPNIPAGIIMPPRELKQYKKWQCLHTNTKPAEQGFIPNAHEYEDFQQWLKRQDSGYFSDIFEDISGHVAPSRPESLVRTFDSPVAPICQHAMHPIAADQLQARCPVCIVEIHVRYMQVLARALANAGGHAPSCTLTSSDHQETVYNAWSKGKVSTLKELSKLETMAEEEVAWSAQHPEAKYDYIQTAAKAVDLYWNETVGSHEDDRSQPKKKAATVAFAEDTDFHPGRPNPYFHRRSPRYEPGKYTVENPEEDDNTPEDPEETSSQVELHMYATEEVDLDTKDEEDTPSLEDDDSLDELLDDDGDSDWEDIESEDEDSDGGSYYEIEEASFIVFGDD